MRARVRILLACGVLLQAGAASAVPPLVIGDVPTADPGGVEVYLGTRYERDGAAGWQVPFTEVVLGVSSWQEVTLELPWLSQGGERGIGDAVLGTKLLLLPEAAERPGVAGSFEWKLANGSQSKGLGSGSMEYDFRVRSQKAWGWLTLFANAGYTVVSSPRDGGVVLERRNVGFAALGGEIELAAGLRLLADAYWRSADVPGEPARVAADLGFKCGVVPHLAVHAAAGTSLRRDGLGGPQVRAYAGVKGDFAAF
jgi:Putative MetA-pathway of phenol degradation